MTEELVAGCACPRGYPVRARQDVTEARAGNGRYCVERRENQNSFD
ncbi:MAG: hypothetical protein K9N07_00135 [Candidatus Cloacimonetes bacterium]|nr:hypothetical protein [Candidatus Cloacimonadota bacterium]